MDITSSYVLNRICESVQQEMAADKLKKDEIDWTVNAEVLFFYALFGHKPVGINRHFMMVLIHKKFTSYIKREISTKALWDHLDSMYDMAALNESEVIPFPNEEVDFELPEDCYDLLYSKYGIKLEKSGNDSEAKDNDKNSASSSKSSRKPGPKSKQIAPSPGTSKSNFASPVLNKPYKSHTAVKSETKTSEVPQKVKSEGPSTKASKIKPSSSPLTSKTLRSESVSEDDSPDVVTIKKSSKSERGGSPASLKKPAKIESSEKNLAKKSSSKMELSDSGLKPIKAEASDGSAKKVRPDKDAANKKGKTVSSSEVPAKKLKVDGNSVKKKNETESTSRKSHESSSLAKQIKAEVKSLSRGREMSTPSPSGSRKSSPVVKIKGNESNKKVKRIKIEESSKKATPSGPKRRRP